MTAQSTASSPIPAAFHTSGPAPAAAGAVLRVLLAVSTCHLINDMVQSLLPSIYPILKNSFRLDFGQIGLLSLTYQVVASLLQPLIGLYTDRRPMPYALAIGMCFTLLGIVMLAMAPTFSQPGNLDGALETSLELADSKAVVSISCIVAYLLT